MPNNELDIIEKELARRNGVEPKKQPGANSLDSELSIIEAELAKRGVANNTNTGSQNEQNSEFSKTKEFGWGRFLTEQFNQGLLNLADAPQHLVESLRDSFGPGIFTGTGPDEEVRKKQEGLYKKPIVSGLIESGTNKIGVDLHSQGEGNTPGQRIAGRTAKFAGSSAIPGGGAAGLARNIGTGAAVGLGSGALQEGTNLPPIAADLTALAAALLTHMGAPKLAGLFKNSPSLTEAEKRVAGYLQNTLGEEATGAVAENLANAPQYPTTGYTPTTAEVANNPLTSQLHRLRQGVPGSGLAEHAGSQNKAINTSADKLSLNKATSGEVKEIVGNELSIRKANRTAETGPLYTELKHEKTQLDTVNIRTFLEENAISKGKKKNDLEYIEQLIKPSKKLTAKEKVITKNYKEQEADILESQMSESAKKQALSQLEKPKNNNPTVADLDEARQNINDLIKSLKKSGEDNRVQQLIQARDALDKDLSKFPKQAEITAKYKELSKPVNEILEDPTLKKLPKSRLNDIFSRLYNNESYDNLISLKQVLKDKPKEWKGIQDASVDYMMKSIRNAGAEGNSTTLSYHKFNKFLEKHEKALKEVFTEDQMKFSNELGSSLKGRNIAETLGLEKGSTTYGKLVAGTHLGEGFGSKLAKGLTYIPHALPIPKLGKATGEILRMRLNNYSKTKEADVMAVLDKVLKDTEYAHKLLNHKFKNQADFNKEMEMVVKQLPSTLVDNDKKNK